MKHEESRLQQQCVTWFRTQYKEFAMLLTHPINEGSRNSRISGAIHKGEGTVAGVPDLLLFLPSFYDGRCRSCLGIEMKTPKGVQSKSQKDYERLFDAASNTYVVVRSFDEFVDVINKWMAEVPFHTKLAVKQVFGKLKEEQNEQDIKKFKKIINKK